MKPHYTRPTDYAHSLQMLIRYKAWMLDVSLQSLSGLPTEELTKIRPTTFKTIAHTLNHIHVIDDMFKAHLEGRSHGYQTRNTENVPSLQDLSASMEAMDRWYIEFVDQHNEAELAKETSFDFVGGGEMIMSRANILHHVINHSTYHIGYISDMMYQIPAEPPTTDLTVFLRDVWKA